MRKPRYHRVELGEKGEEVRYLPTNESRDAYGNFKRQYRTKIESEPSPPARSKVPHYEAQRSEYREQNPKETKAESQRRESETQMSKLSDETSIERGIEREVQKNVTDFLDANHGPDTLEQLDSDDWRNADPDVMSVWFREKGNTLSDEQRSEFIELLTKKLNEASNELKEIDSQILEEELEIVKDAGKIEATLATIDELKPSETQQNMQSDALLTQTEIHAPRVEQPREVLDSLEQEMKYLDNHLSKNPTHLESLPELMGDLFETERRMNDVMERVERKKPIEPEPYEESGEL